MERLYLSIFIIVFISMITIPMIALESDEKTVKVSSSAVTEKAKTTKASTEQVKVYFSDEKKTKEVPIEEYLLGVVLCEMDGSYHDEALKAQAVAAHTLLLFRQKENADKSYDITDDYSKDQGYLSKTRRQEKYGDTLTELENRVKPLVNSVKNEIIYYENEPILAVYHDTSGGKTENAKDIWGGDYPYLTCVDSISDLLNPKYLSTVTYTRQEFVSRLKSENAVPSKSGTISIGTPSTTQSGTVKTIKIGTKTFSGSKIRELFDLRSANFDLKHEDEKYIFTVRGYGHGVGMSQFGASFMGKEGSNYKEILQWYYKGCKVK